MAAPELDDLSLLIAPDADISSFPHTDNTLDDPLDDPLDDTLDDPLDDTLDDLSALISAPPSLRPDITPEENLKEYKAAVMQIILGLKTQDLSPEETTRRLNQDGVQTISGKSQWSERSISQIYKFIDSAK